jgi:hypothetical protein
MGTVAPHIRVAGHSLATSVDLTHPTMAALDVADVLNGSNCDVLR